VYSVYVPNGREPDSEHYAYKLKWLAALRDVVAADGPDSAVVTGDMNIAPADEDVFDPDAYVGQTHVTEPERAALAELTGGGLGLRDVVRDRWPGERVFTYWDYRAGMFHQDLGMRIDLVLAGAPVAERVKAAWIDRQARKGSGPSDHAPVIVDLDEAPDGDIGPVVPPPSAPVTRRGAKKLPQSP
jgi:exodeoxyribonuclease-3